MHHCFRRSEAAAGADLAAGAPGPGVVVWSDAPDDAGLLGTLSACGIRSRVLRGEADDWPEASSAWPLAILAGALDADRRAIAGAIERLRAAGFEILACQDGADGRPLASRCDLLLAGCPTLIDSAAPGFAGDLHRIVLPALARAATQREEDDRLRVVMREAGLMARTPAMLAVCRQVLRISGLSDLSTLIVGESGTGKEHFARVIHRHDARRADGPFVAVNCSTLGPALADAELFGHRRGAFTGADRDRRGLFRAAHRGVLFLDEVAELPPAVQAKLLRVLQERRVLPVGDEREEAVDVRVVAATHADLPQMVAAGAFRADLYHRLNVLSVHVPPLRERTDDVPALVKHFLDKHRDVNPGVADVRPEFVEALTHLPLPGNARELENLVCRALVHHDGPTPLGLDDLPIDTIRAVALRCAPAPAAGNGGGPAVAPGAPRPATAGRDWNLARLLRACERQQIEAALTASDGNQAATARLLGITPRSVYNKLRRHRIA
jgi:DNA-binding NtrC family response regulator/biotin operon repressor